jgi:hypothetical protein
MDPACGSNCHRRNSLTLSQSISTTRRGRTSSPRNKTQGNRKSCGKHAPQNATRKLTALAICPISPACPGVGVADPMAPTNRPQTLLQLVNVDLEATILHVFAETPESSAFAQSFGQSIVDGLVPLSLILPHLLPRTSHSFIPNFDSRTS